MSSDMTRAISTAIGVVIQVRGKWNRTAPIVWPPQDDIRELRQAAREVLPGARVRRLLFGRYLLT
jgi:hypothetical protein